MLAIFGSGSTRMELPGGGSAAIPAPYDRKPSYPAYSERVADEVLIGYRNWRPTMSGQPECDGMLAVGRADRFQTLRDFMNTARAGLSIHWSAADTIPGQPWTGDEKTYPVEKRAGENGAELVQLLSVHRSGWLRVYDVPALMYVVAHSCGAHIGVWITNKQGGARRALALANRIAATFQS